MHFTTHRVIAERSFTDRATNRSNLLRFDFKLPRKTKLHDKTNFNLDKRSIEILTL